jgi:hypothetical protein
VTEGAGKTWTNRKTGESGTTKGHQLPVEYLPLDGSAATQMVMVEYDVASVGLDDPTLRDLTTYAQGLSLGEFQSRGISLVRGLQDENVRGNLTKALSDSSFYETLRQSESAN